MESELRDDDEHARVEEIVVLLYLGFYFLIYLPRGAVQ
jgi:hypothetical protein